MFMLTIYEQFLHYFYFHFHDHPFMDWMIDYWHRYYSNDLKLHRALTKRIVTVLYDCRCSACWCLSCCCCCSERSITAAVYCMQGWLNCSNPTAGVWRLSAEFDTDVDYHCIALVVAAAVWRWGLLQIAVKLLQGWVNCSTALQESDVKSAVCLQLPGTKMHQKCYCTHWDSLELISNLTNIKSIHQLSFLKIQNH